MAVIEKGWLFDYMPLAERRRAVNNGLKELGLSNTLRKDIFDYMLIHDTHRAMRAVLTFMIWKGAGGCPRHLLVTKTSCTCV